MGLTFWRKTKDTDNQHEPAVAVSEDNPLPVRPLQDDTDDPTRVQIDMTYLPSVAGTTRLIGPLQIPGIGTGSAYADGDAFGTLITFYDCFRPEKCSGTIVAVLFYDMDDEGKTKDFPFFACPFTVTADNSAFAISDNELHNYRGAISVSSYFNWGNNQVGQNTIDRLWVKSDTPHLYCQIVTRDTDNIAAGAIPLVALVVVPD